MSNNSKRESKIFIFYIKNNIFQKILKTKSDQNTHQFAPFKKISRESMPPNPSNKAHGEAMCSKSLSNMHISNPKKISWPPFPNPDYAPEATTQNLNMAIPNILH